MAVKCRVSPTIQDGAGDRCLEGERHTTPTPKDYITTDTGKGMPKWAALGGKVVPDGCVSSVILLCGCDVISMHLCVCAHARLCTCECVMCCVYLRVCVSL